MHNGKLNIQSQTSPSTPAQDYSSTQTPAHTPIILSPIFAQRIARQNGVLRKLRQLGCSILATHTDTELTIQVSTTDAILLCQRYGTPAHTLQADQFVLWIDDCRITWQNAENK